MLELSAYVIVFVLLSGLMALIEAAILSISRGEIEELVLHKVWGARTLRAITQQLPRTVVVLVLFTGKESADWMFATIMDLWLFKLLVHGGLDATSYARLFRLTTRDASAHLETMLALGLIEWSAREIPGERIRPNLLNEGFAAKLRTSLERLPPPRGDEQ